MVGKLEIVQIGDRKLLMKELLSVLASKRACKFKVAHFLSYCQYCRYKKVSCLHLRSYPIEVYCTFLQFVISLKPWLLRRGKNVLHNCSHPDWDFLFIITQNIKVTIMRN